jgi:IS5 family transposase
MAFPPKCCHNTAFFLANCGFLNKARSIAAQWMSATFDAKMCSSGLILAQKRPGVFHMHRHEQRHQLSFEDFFLPFGGKLFGDNSWIKLAELIPWDELEDDYAAQFCTGFGAPALPFRMALGALIIKAHIRLTD